VSAAKLDVWGKARAMRRGRSFFITAIYLKFRPCGGGGSYRVEASGDFEPVLEESP
jgi:hypothetical protein